MSGKNLTWYSSLDIRLPSKYFSCTSIEPAENGTLSLIRQHYFLIPVVSNSLLELNIANRVRQIAFTTTVVLVTIAKSRSSISCTTEGPKGRA